MKRFRARGRKGATVFVEEEEEEEEDDPVAARAVCMHCGEGGAEDRLILCDGSGCGNVSREALSSNRNFSLPVVILRTFLGSFLFFQLFTSRIVLGVYTNKEWFFVATGAFDPPTPSPSFKKSFSHLPLPCILTTGVQ